MADLPLTSASDGSIAFSTSDDNVPIFILIGDSFSLGTVGNQVGADRRVDPDYTYGCKNFERRLTPGYISDSSNGSIAFQVWDQNFFLLEKPAWLTSTAYAVGDAVADDTPATGEDNQYVCKVAHTSGATTEPGAGASWEDYWEQSASWGYVPGRTYTGTGTDGKFAVDDCKPRAALAQSGSSDGYAAAGWSGANSWSGGSRTAAVPPHTAGVSDLPFDVHTPSLFLQDNNLLWTFGKFFVFNQVFKDADGGVVYPRYIHTGVNGAAAGKASAAFRRLSWSPDYTDPAVNTDYASAYEWFHDTYLKPAIAAVETTESKNAWIAGVIFLGGSVDCQNSYNDSLTGGPFAGTFDNVNKPCDNLGASVTAIADALETACSTANIPFMCMNPINVETGANGSEATGSSKYHQRGANSIEAAFDGDPYRKSFTLYGQNSPNRHIGSNDLHLTATGAARLGFELADSWYTNFVDKGLSIHTATEPTHICDRT